MSNVLQDIFSDYYEQILYEIHPRHSVMEKHRQNGLLW